jgi:hypothetical protein
MDDVADRLEKDKYFTGPLVHGEVYYEDDDALSEASSKGDEDDLDDDDELSTSTNSYKAPEEELDIKDFKKKSRALSEGTLDLPSRRNETLKRQEEERALVQIVYFDRSF